MFAPERIFRNASQRLKIQNQAFAATWMDLEIMLLFSRSVMSDSFATHGL